MKIRARAVHPFKRLRRRSALALAALSALASGLAAAPAGAVTVVWAGGNGSWDDPAKWASAAVPNNAFIDVLIDNQPLQASSVSLTDYTNVGNLTVQAGDSLHVGAAGYLAVYGGTLINQGSLTVGGGNTGYAFLHLGSNTTLAGNGQTVLASDPSGYHGQVLGNHHTLTIGSGHTLRGSGHLGSGDIALVNHGTLVADGPAPLTVQLVAGPAFDNSSGLIRVGDGGTLAVNSGTVSGGSITGLGQSVLDGTATFQNLVLQGPLLLGGGGLTLRDLALSGTVAVRPGGGAYLGGTLTNTGSLTVVGSNAGHAHLYLAENTTLAGSGQTVLGTDASGYHGQVFGHGHTLTIGAGHTVRGNGYLGGNDLSVVNQGTLIAQGSQSLHVNLLSGNSFDNRAGRVRVAAGASLDLNAGTLWGGVIEGQGSAAITGSGVFKDTTLAGTLRMAPNTGAYLAGTITNTGSLTVAGSNAGYAYLYLAEHTTLAGSGQTVLSADASGYYGQVFGHGHTLTIGAGHTVRGNGHLGGNDLRIVNQGTLIAEGSQALTISPLGGDSFDNSAGTVQVAQGGSLVLNTGTLFGGVVQGQGNAALSGGGVFRDTTLAGTLRVPTNDGVRVAGTLTNAGELALAGSSSGYAHLFLAGDTTLAGSGQTVLRTDVSGYHGQLIGSNYTLTIAAGHTLRGAGQLGAGDLGLINQGHLIAEGGILVANTTHLDNSDGLIELARDGMLALDSTGLTLGDGANLHFNIGGPGAHQHGLISYSGNASFDGQLSLYFDDYAPQVGDSFTLLAFQGTGSGSFDAVQASGWVLATHYNAHDVTVTVMGAVPEPGSWALLLAGLVLGLPALRRRARRA